MSRSARGDSIARRLTVAWMCSLGSVTGDLHGTGQSANLYRAVSRIDLSDAVEDYLRRYEVMVAAAYRPGADAELRSSESWSWRSVTSAGEGHKRCMCAN
jgi:hypothetical protein